MAASGNQPDNTAVLYDALARVLASVSWEIALSICFLLDNLVMSAPGPSTVRIQVQLYSLVYMLDEPFRL